jgi:UTP-glucose-1-phosphate uridylyltransferase
LYAGELQLRDAMEALLKAEGMYGLRMAGQRHDTGIPHEFAKTVAVFNELAIANGH